MLTNIFKNGKELSYKEIREYIQKSRKWTKARYEKEIERYSKGLRTLRKNQGKTSFNKQSAVEILYKETKTRERQRKRGESYTPSISLKLLREISKPKRVTLGKRTLKRRTSHLVEKAILDKFENLINNNAGALRIYQSIKDPIKRNQALADYADKLKMKMAENEKLLENIPVPMETDIVGSETEIEFDLTDYL